MESIFTTWQLAPDADIEAAHSGYGFHHRIRRCLCGALRFPCRSEGKHTVSSIAVNLTGLLFGQIQVGAIKNQMSKRLGPRSRPRTPFSQDSANASSILFLPRGFELPIFSRRLSSTSSIWNRESETIEELTMRLKALEAKETSTQSELKKLADAKKAPAEKPKFPNVAISGVFQADAVTFNQLESSREAYAGRLIE